MDNLDMYLKAKGIPYETIDISSTILAGTTENIERNIPLRAKYFVVDEIYMGTTPDELDFRIEFDDGFVWTGNTRRFSGREVKVHQRHIENLYKIKLTNTGGNVVTYWIELRGFYATPAELSFIKTAIRNMVEQKVFGEYFEHLKEKEREATPAVRR